MPGCLACSGHCWCAAELTSRPAAHCFPSFPPAHCTQGWIYSILYVLFENAMGTVKLWAVITGALRQQGRGMPAAVAGASSFALVPNCCKCSIQGPHPCIPTPPPNRSAGSAARPGVGGDHQAGQLRQAPRHRGQHHRHALLPPLHERAGGWCWVQGRVGRWLMGCVTGSVQSWNRASPHACHPTASSLPSTPPPSMTADLVPLHLCLRPLRPAVRQRADRHGLLPAHPG